MLLFLLIVASVTWYSIFRYKRARLYELASRIPGPKPSYPLIGSAIKFAGSSESVMGSMKEVSYFAIKNNGLAKLWMGPILFFLMTDPTDLEVVLKNCLEKDDIHRYVRDFIGYGTGFAPVPVWRKRRKIMIPAFSPKIVDNFVEVFSKQSHKLARLLDRRDGTGKFSLWTAISTYTLDSVFENVTGVNLNSQENPENRILNLLSQGMHLICARMTHIWLMPDWLFNLFPIHKEYYDCIKNVHEAADEIVSTKRNEIVGRGMAENNVIDGIESYKKQTFLELLLNSSGGEKGYNNVELREEVMSLVIAGTDTSAGNIGYTLKLMAMYPDIQEKVYQELNLVFGDSDRPIVKEDLSKLQYLECVVKESLRLFPPAPFIIRKVTEELTLPSGRVLPTGSGVVVSIWGVHRDPKYWGEDVEEFRPERFMPEEFKLANTCSYMPFSSGPRNCIGYQYALMSVKTALSNVLRRHKIVGVSEKTTTPEIRVKLEIMMKSVDEYEVALVKRK